MADQIYPGKLRPDLRSRLGAALRTHEDLSIPIPKASIELKGTLRPLERDDIPAVIVARNEARLVRPFLRHYRGLGVTRFIWVDDASTDGSPDWLRAQPDVDLLTSNVRFGAATRGRAWREMVVDRLGRDRWYLMLDADEFLIYSDCEATPLRALIRALEAAGIRHMFAPMLDMYPGGVIEETRYDSEAMPWSVAGLFDGGGYSARSHARGWYLDGGPRHRVFPTTRPPLLSKYPVIYWDNGTTYNRRIHYPTPYRHNFSPALGALLHFKFFADFQQRFREIQANGQHYNASLHYTDLLERLTGTETVFEYDGSVAYQRPEQLQALGFFEDWRRL